MRDASEHEDDWNPAQPGFGVLRLSGPSVAELTDFVAAVVGSAESVLRDNLVARMLVLDDESPDMFPARLGPQHVIVASGRGISRAEWCRRQFGCRVLFLDCQTSVQDAPVMPGVPSARIEARPFGVFVECLTGIGYPASEIAALCERCDCDYLRIRQEVFRQ